MIKPDFLLIPYEVHACEGLRPSDSTVYAVVYWFERLRDGKCIASNETIAEIAMMEPRTVRAALDRLEKNGLIKRIFETENSRSSKREMTNRLEIKTLVSFTRGMPEQKVYKTKSAKIPKDQMITPGSIVHLDDPGPEESKDTPGQVARDFFNPDSDTRSKIIDEIVKASGVKREDIAAEVKKFYLYWTEPTKSGRKQLWETKTTFEVKRRLYTWLSRSQKYSNASTKSRAGAGVTI